MQRLQGWKEKFLSKAGREILIKAVAQAIPTYAMNCFKLPKTWCEEINSLIARYWWGQKNEENSIGFAGINCALPNLMEDWDSETCICSIWLCWQSSVGDSFRILNLYFTESSKRGTSRTTLSWKQLWEITHRSYGGVFYQAERLS